MKTVPRKNDEIATWFKHPLIKMIEAVDPMPKKI